MTNAKLIKGRWVLTGDEVIADAAVAIEGGRIIETGSAAALSRRYDGAEVIGSEHSAVLPGFVNAHHHSHGVSTIQHGCADALLESWILGFAGLRKGRVYEETLLSAANQLRSGVTSVVDVHSAGGTAADYEASVDAGLQAYAQAGIRVAFATGTATQSHLVHGAGQDDAFVAELPADLREGARALLPGPDRVSDEDYLEIVTARAADFDDHPLIDVWFAPPGPQWVSDELMQRIGERADALDTRIQTHCNESFYEKLHGDRFYGCPTVVHLERLGVLSERFSIAHGVWLTETEIAALARTGAAVSHNPSSNLRLRAGIAPLNALLESGVSVALGMDGTTINEDEDMFSELRLGAPVEPGTALRRIGPEHRATVQDRHPGRRPPHGKGKRNRPPAARLPRRFDGGRPRTALSGPGSRRRSILWSSYCCALARTTCAASSLTAKSSCVTAT